MVDGQNGEDNIMKRFFLTAIAFFLMFALASCNQISESNETTEATQEETTERLHGHSYAFLPDFTSIEDLIEAQKTVREGKAVGDLTVEATAAAVENTNFTELKKLYVPTAIPEGYHLTGIRVLESTVMFWHSSESDDQDFLCTTARNADFTLDKTLRYYNATEEDLVDGKYFFIEPNGLCWELDGVYLSLSVPLPLLEKLPDEQAKIAEMIKYAEVEVVDLGV